jgi:hypothetical protein
MMLFSRRFEHALDVTVQRPHDADARAVQALPSGPMINQIASAADHLGPHDGKANPHRGMMADRGSLRMDGLRLGGWVWRDLGVPRQGPALLSKRDVEGVQVDPDIASGRFRADTVEKVLWG